jgi:peptidoglycan-N-acetylglucosamine deacetylase
MERTLILSVDFEDWNQLVRRRVGDSGWDVRGPALARQTDALLCALESIGARATFFVLGITARRYPELVGEIAQRGHELACHGFEHRRVYDGDAAALRGDLERCIDLIGQLSGRRPIGYRAPAFSINRATPWAYDVLADLGFAYDSSQYDSPRIPDRIHPVPRAPFEICLGSGRRLWELPVAAWRVGSRSVPVGGGAYWRVLPERALMRGLQNVAREGLAALYVHPYECDPAPLRARVAPGAPLARRLHARARELQRNPRRRRVLSHVRAVGHHFHLLTCERAYEQLSRSTDESPSALSRARQVV